MKPSLNPNSNPTPSSSTAPIRKSRWESHPNPNPNPNPIPNPNPNPNPTRNPNPNPNPSRNPNPNPNPSRNPNPNSNPNRNPNPNPKISPAPHPSAQISPPPPAAPPPPPPPYGFHNLDRLTIMLVDGTVRSYFALPPDYPLPPRPHLGHFPQFDRLPEHNYHPELTAGTSSSINKRHVERDELLPNSYIPLTFVEDMRVSKRARVERQADEGVRGLIADANALALKRAFLKYCKVVNESPIRRIYLGDGMNGPLPCVVCGRTSKDFPDIYGLILHAYNSQDAERRIDHLGLHKALCVLVGWDYLKNPSNSKTNMLLSAENAQANRDDLILWPPIVVIHNTFSGRTKDGRELGLGNIEMDNELKELGFGVGKAKKVLGKEGPTGITAVKFDGTRTSLKEAERLAEYFEKENRGRNGWERAEASSRYGDDDKNPALVMVDPRTGEKKRIFYGYLGTASDLDKLDPDMMKKVVIQSRKELDLDLFD